VSKEEISIFTDGSTDLSFASASCLLACERFPRAKLCFLLRPMEGAQAELVAGLFALLAIEAFLPGDKGSAHWTTDNQSLKSLAEKYLDDGATPADPLWVLWLRYAQLRPLRISWTRAHVGQRENEACDKACRWVRTKGALLLSKSGEGQMGLSVKRRDASAWFLVDARGFDPLQPGERTDELSSIERKLQPAREIFSLRHPSK